jgi:hypothetical protein
MTSKSRDHLTETTDQGKIELKEKELKRVTGGFFKKVPVTTRSGLLWVNGHSSSPRTQVLKSKG